MVVVCVCVYAVCLMLSILYKIRISIRWLTGNEANAHAHTHNLSNVIHGYYGNSQIHSPSFDPLRLQGFKNKRKFKIL